MSDYHGSFLMKTAQHLLLIPGEGWGGDSNRSTASKFLFILLIREELIVVYNTYMLRKDQSQDLEEYIGVC